MNDSYKVGPLEIKCEVITPGLPIYEAISRGYNPTYNWFLGPPCIHRVRNLHSQNTRLLLRKHLFFSEEKTQRFRNVAMQKPEGDRAYTVLPLKDTSEKTGNSWFAVSLAVMNGIFSPFRWWLQ